MANTGNVSVTLITEPFILSFPQLDVPRAYQPKGSAPMGEPRYSFEAISDKEALQAWQILDRDKGEFSAGDVQKRLVRLAREKWGAKYNVVAAVKDKDLGWPFKPGDKKADEKGAKMEIYRGRMSWRAHANAEINGRPNPPTLYEAEEGGLVKLMRTTEAGKARIAELFYGGAICTAEVNAVAMETPQGKFITLYLNSVVFEKDGERLGGVSAMERVRGVKGGSTSYDPSAGMGPGKDEMDDEIPF